ncbi:MAG: alpha/beta fold hydrolase [Bacteroidia bacterium]|nr:alpha/beta fold hydrolase [Bacteroidia bacterium]
MKINSKILKFSAIVLIFFTVVTSCTKDDNSPGYSYFVSKEFKFSYTRGYINSLIDIVSISVPEVSNLKPLVASDINVYKMIYKTTINGHQINASGLVCVPSTPGDYPVLSFQNGTNTVSANAPSELPSDYSYQLVEIIASMGYVVVIADYPGFGESVQVPHPYLVAEPTIRSLVDMLFAVKELSNSELPGISLKNEYYLIGYSQGGWATLALHKAIEIDYHDDFNLKGSACGAGPYNIFLLLQGMVNLSTYPMPVYLGYILNAYTSYNQFTNPVTDIFKEPYATRVSSLYTGLLTSGQINSQLTTSIVGLITPAFLSGFATSPKYASVRDAFNNNSITAWHTYKPLLMMHGAKDTHVDPVSTENMYSAMVQAGTSADICQKVIIPNVDHGDGVVPFMIQSLLFLKSLSTSN